MRADIAAAQTTLSDVTGHAPQFFRPTAGLRNPLLDPVLASLDLRLASWTRRPYDTRASDGRRVLERLTGRLGPGDILLLHDGNAGLTPVSYTHLDVYKRQVPVLHAIGVTVGPGALLALLLAAIFVPRPAPR